MMRTRWILALLLLASNACYHQVVQTGHTPSSAVVDLPWVKTWLWGLVEAEPIDARPTCATGVAVIETETSFMNGLVGVLTFGIFTPQHVRITCATGTASLPSGASEMRIPINASTEERTAIVSRAVEQAAESHAPVVLRF